MTRCLSSPYSKKFGPDSWCSEERAEECEDGHDLTTSCINKTTLIKREMAVTGSLIITYPLLAFAFGFDTDNRLPLGLVHNYSPLISSCQTIKIINVKYVIKGCCFLKSCPSGNSNTSHTFAIFSFSLRLLILSIRPAETSILSEIIEQLT